MITILFLLLGIFMVVGMPIGFALGMPALIYSQFVDPSLMLAIPQKMFTSMNSFPLLAVPLFILAGGIMQRGGIASILIDFINCLVGWVRGGLAYVNILHSMFFGGISGSAVADIMAEGPIIIPEMSRRGYPIDFTAALTASSASLGIIIPPSIPMIIYAVTAETSIARLFVAGIIPALFVAGGQMVVTCYLSSRHHFPRGTFPTFGYAWKAFKPAAPTLMLPIIIMGGIMLGIVTPTEAAVLAVIVAAILGSFVYRKITWKDYKDILHESAIQTAILCLILAGATLYSWVLAITNMPEIFSQLMLKTADNPIIILFLIDLFLLFIGVFLVSGPAIVITVPMLLPIVEQIGISPIHFGIIMTISIAIGQQTPPVGNALFATSIISKRPIEAIAKANVPFILSMIGVLFIITYIPWISLWLPGIVFK